jgi:hypothetical protein
VAVELRGRQLAVPVSINGQAVGLLLDTGSEKSFLTEATVERLHIPRDARFNTAIIGIGGGSARVDASVDHMLIGGVPLPVDRISVNSFSGRPRFDGLIGLDILRDFDLDIDTPKRTSRCTASAFASGRIRRGTSRRCRSPEHRPKRVG